MKRVGSLMGVLVFGLICFLILKSILTQTKLRSAGRYSIALTSGSKTETRGKQVKYKFTYSGIEYEGEQRSLKYSPIENDGRYFILILPSDPYTNNIMWDKPVPDCIGEPPADGWAEIPECK